MSKKFFETDSFIKIKQEWDAKLKASGFEDIEVSESETVVRPQIVSTKSKFATGLDYYEFCQRVLRDYNFKRDIDRVIFELHTEGKSVRDISEYLDARSSKKVSKTRVDEIIKRIKEDFGRSV